MVHKIVFITGGARSGKSRFALKETSKVSGKKAFIATATAIDDEMRRRIEEHRRERGDEWDTYEYPIEIPKVIKEIEDKYSVIVIDCLTLWLSNVIHRTQNAEHRSQNTDHRQRTTETEKSILQLIDVFIKLKDSSVCSLGSGFCPVPDGTGFCSLYIVSNEVGMGIVPDNELARRFRDMAGILNQKVAGIADEVYLVTAGIPLKIK